MLMKTTSALILTAALLTGGLYAGPNELIKQRAKELSNQNNVRQGVAPPVPPAKPTSAPVTTTAPSLQQQALARLKADLAAIKANAQVTPAQKAQLARDLIAAAGGPAKPSQASAAKFAEDVSAALAEKPLSDTSRARFVQELDAVLNPAKYPGAKMDAIFTDIQAIFQANGLARKNAVTISDGIKTIAAEAKGMR